MSDEEIHFARDECEAASDRLRRVAGLLDVETSSPPMTQMDEALAKLSPPVAAALLVLLNTKTETPLP